MNIICGTLTKMNVSLHITDTLEGMGHSVRFFPTEQYREICSYSDKKLDKLGFHQGRERYLTHWRENFFNTIEEFQPDVILFLNAPNAVLHPENIKKTKHLFTPPRFRKFCVGSLTVSSRAKGRNPCFRIMIMSMFLKNGIFHFCRNIVISLPNTVLLVTMLRMRDWREGKTKMLISPLWELRFGIVCIS